jgi:hypothetical protein
VRAAVREEIRRGVVVDAALGQHERCDRVEAGFLKYVETPVEHALMLAHAGTLSDLLFHSLLFGSREAALNGRKRQRHHSNEGCTDVPRMRDAPKPSTTENRLFMTVLAHDTLISDARLSDVLSPELVLVSPPEVARFARSLLSAPPLGPLPSYTPARRDMQPGQAELAMVWLICTAMTLGPLLFILVLRP